MRTSAVIVALALTVVFTQGAEVTFVRCPNGSMCPDRTTCCMTGSGQYGCCPYPFAVCCNDYTHCCPEGYRCHLSNGSCLQISTSVKEVETLLTPMVLSPQLGLNEPAIEQVRCPDGNYCQDGQTCCLLSGGMYGCCPYPHAVCCSDHTSCCPEGYRCTVSSRTCVAGNSTLPMLKKVSSISGVPPKDPAPVERVRCPDGNYCQDGQTCCLTTGGKFGCCPYPHAECCSDHASCCPEGYRCQISTRSCIAGNSTVAMLKKVSTFSDSVPDTPASGNKVSCPDGSSCLDQQTCCQGKNGSYGCCPAPEAICCDDHELCCPKGTVCVVPLKACLARDKMTPMLKKVPALRNAEMQPHPVSKVVCPGGGTCEDGQTCCPLRDKGYGCCSYENATCCSDGVHCCPSGYTCDTVAVTCRMGDVFAVALRKVPARRPPTPVVYDQLPTDRVCPDGSECDDNNTCCEILSHGYGCCPLEDATCCSDLMHCCPHGTKCYKGGQKCVPSNDGTTVPMTRISPRSSLHSVEVRLTDHRCPDGHECDDDETCCEIRDHGYGCCPFKDATCCSDLIHCCPHGTRCDSTGRKCLRSDNATAITMRMLSPRAPLNLAEVRLLDNTCKDGHVCPGDTTCCPTPSGRYNCCPFASGVCCSDGEHCCPQGFKCDLTTGRCVSDSLYPFLKRVPMLPKFPSSALRP